MRKDMSKVVIERPRSGSGWRRKGRTVQLEGEDDTPLRQRVVANEPPGTKQLNDNLAPLRRFLEKNVGRSWNKVYSEIAENIRPTSTLQKHVLEHVDDFVGTKTFMKGGIVHVLYGRYGGKPVPVGESYFLLYVHPKTGKLMRNRNYRTLPPGRVRKKDKPEDRRRDLGPLRQAHFFTDGAWWDVVLEANPSKKTTVREQGGKVVSKKAPLPFEDVVFASNLSAMSPEQLYGRPGVHAVSLRRIPKAERKKLGLP